MRGSAALFSAALLAFASGAPSATSLSSAAFQDSQPPLEETSEEAPPPAGGAAEEEAPKKADGAPGALRLGNQDFRAGRLDEALEAYRRGWSAGERDPILAYNLGTTAHHLDSLPQAILWYRRAAEGLAGDRWLEENLELARARLQAPRLGPVGVLGLLSLHRRTLYLVGVLLAWSSLVAMLIRPRLIGPFERLPEVLIVAAALTYSLGLATARLGPGPAILLDPCGEGEARLPAGTEAWVRKSPSEEAGEEAHHWRIDTGQGFVICPQEAVARIQP